MSDSTAARRSTGARARCCSSYPHHHRLPPPPSPPPPPPPPSPCPLYVGSPVHSSASISGGHVIRVPLPEDDAVARASGSDSFNPHQDDRLPLCEICVILLVVFLFHLLLFIFIVFLCFRCTFSRLLASLSLSLSLPPHRLHKYGFRVPSRVFPTFISLSFSALFLLLSSLSSFSATFFLFWLGFYSRLSLSLRFYSRYSYLFLYLSRISICVILLFPRCFFITLSSLSCRPAASALPHAGHVFRDERHSVALFTVTRP